MSKTKSTILLITGVAIGALVFSPVGFATPFSDETVNNSSLPVNGSEIANSSINISLNSKLNKSAARVQLHDQTNSERSSRGVSKLEYNDELERAAQYHAMQMANGSFFAHTSPSGETVRDRYRKFGLPCRAAENIFMMSSGTNPSTIANETVESWMASEGHRENLMRPRFSAQAFGIAEGDGSLYVVQNFC